MISLEMGLKKLKAKNGSSIFVALVFFLLCSVVGTLILTGATANAGRLRAEREELRRYLAVSSAARLLHDAADGLITHYEVDVVDGDGNVIGTQWLPLTLSSPYSEVAGFLESPDGTTLTIDAGSGYEEVTALRTPGGVRLYTAADGFNAMEFTVKRSVNYTWSSGDILKVDEL